MRKLIFKDLIEQEEVKINDLDNKILHKVRPFPHLTDKENEDYLEYSRNESSEKLKDLTQKLADIDGDQKILLKDLIEQAKAKIIILDDQISNQFKTFVDVSDQDNDGYLQYSRNQLYDTLNNLKQKLVDTDFDFIGVYSE